MTNEPRHTSEYLFADLLKLCIHCGLCLPTCPTYALTKSERSSPRGRLKLIRHNREHGGPFSKEFLSEMYFCLECLACESACPAGVQFGSFMESTRAEITAQKVLPLRTRMIRAAFLNWIFQARPRLKFMSWLLSKGKTVGGARIFKPLYRLGKRFGLPVRLLGLIPDSSSHTSLTQISEFLPASEGSTQRLRVGFVTGCVMDISFADVNLDTVALLRDLGCDVVTPKNQWCCGSVHAHQGELEVAQRMAEDLLKSFDIDSLDAIVLNAAGCSGFVKKYGKLFEADNELHVRASAFSKKSVDVVELLDELLRGRSDLRLNPMYQNKRVTFDDPCHLIHAQKIKSAPRAVIRSIPGLDFVELPEADWCCGSAGVYNITHHDDSMKLLDRKIRHVAAIRADIVLTSNPGCIIQLKHGLAERGLKTEVLHLATFLRRALAA